jgi:HD-like signal output (HDOD) protein
MSAIETIISRINNLPTLPTVYSHLAEAIEDPTITIDQLARIISSDQSSVFKILKVANSPFYGFRGKVDTISQALLYLGFNEIKNIVFALSVINIFSKEKVIRDFGPIDLWSHSIGTGIITRCLGAAAREKNLENYFLAGVFHDIGKLVFMEFASKEYKLVVELVHSKKIRISEAESEIFGGDHSLAGSLLAEKWKLPASIQKVIQSHHDFKENDQKDLLLASIHLANILAKVLKMGYTGDPFIQRPNQKIWNILKISPGYLYSIKNSITEDYNHAIRLMLVE